MAKRKENNNPTDVPALSPRKTRSSTRKLEKKGAAATQPPSARPASKKRKVAVISDKVEQEEKVALVSEKSSSEFDKKVIIEACKQCKSFERTALRVKDGLEKQVSGINVIINPEKPRRGCFEVRGATGDMFLSLLDMKRPFKPMKDLNLHDLVQDIVGKIE